VAQSTTRIDVEVLRPSTLATGIDQIRTPEKLHNIASNTATAFARDRSEKRFGLALA